MGVAENNPLFPTHTGGSTEIWMNEFPEVCLEETCTDKHPLSTSFNSILESSSQCFRRLQTRQDSGLRRPLQDFDLPSPVVHTDDSIRRNRAAKLQCRNRTLVRLISTGVDIEQRLVHEGSRRGGYVIVRSWQ